MINLVTLCYHQRDIFSFSSEYNNIFFLPKTVSYCDTSREHDAQLGPRTYGPRSSLFHDWSGRNKRCSLQGFVPHLHDGPFVGIGWLLKPFRPLHRSFCAFFLLGPFRPLPLFPYRTFVSICPTLRRNGALASRLRPLSLFSRSSSSLLSS